MADNLLYRLGGHIVVSDPRDVSQTVAELRNVDESIWRGERYDDILQLALGDVRYNEHGTDVPAVLDFGDDHGENTLILYVPDPPPVVVRDPAAGLDEIEEMVAILESGDREELIALVERQLDLRRRDLVMLRRLMYIHHTAVQNAVDIVQSKRLDFLEERETWAEGSAGSLFFTVLFAIFPAEALVAKMLGSLARSAVRVVGSRVLSRTGSKELSGLTARITTLEGQVRKLKNFNDTKSKYRRLKGLRGTKEPLRKKLLKDQKALGVVASDPVLSTSDIRKLKSKNREIERLKEEKAVGEANRKQLLDFLIESAPRSFKESPMKVLPTVLGKLVEKKAETVGDKKDEYAEQMKARAEETDPILRAISGAPLDVVIKEQVQELYASLVFHAEDTISALEGFRDTCRFELPVEEEYEALLALLVAEPPAEPEAGQTPTDIKAEDVQRLVAAATGAYEQMIWLFLFAGPQLEVSVLALLSETDENYRESTRKDYLVPIHGQLMSYLRSRFYPELDVNEVAKVYESLSKAIAQRNSAGGGGSSDTTLDLSCFDDPNRILSLVKDVNFHIIEKGKKPR